MIQFLDALAIFFMISMGVIGFRRGVIEELGRLLGLIISMIFSLSFYIDLSSFLFQWIKFDITVLTILSFILLFLKVILHYYIF